MNEPLLLEELSEKDSGGRRLGIYRCRCGKVWKTAITHVKHGYTQSCGCIVTKHGMSGTREYKIWGTMKDRCNNPNHHEYHAYGARGITVCQEWMNSFETFYADMGPRPGKNYSIERIDNDLGYCKENCRWATAKEQSRNTRRNRLITFNGETKTLVEWSEITGLTRQAIEKRLDAYGWTVEDALTKPKMKNQFG